MKTIRSIAAYFSTVLLLIGCGPSNLDPGNYEQWISSQENNLNQEKIIGNIAFELQYKPIDYILRAEETSTEDFKRRRAELEGLSYFDLTIRPEDPAIGNLLKAYSSDQAEYQRAIYYYSYRFKDNLKILAGEDTIPCELYHFVRDHGLSPKLRFVLAFEEPKQKQDLIFLINDEVFDNGNIKFRFDQNDLENIPNLNIQLTQL